MYSALSLLAYFFVQFVVYRKHELKVYRNTLFETKEINVDTKLKNGCGVTIYFQLMLYDALTILGCKNNAPKLHKLDTLISEVI